MRDRRALARAAATLGVVSLACLDDSPTAPITPDGGARLRIHAQIAGGQAVDRTLRIRIFYRRAGAGAPAQEINLPANPAEILVTSGTTQSQEVIVDLSACFGDAQRVGPEAGCRFSIELTLIDTDGEMLSRQTEEVNASSPGDTVEPPPIVLPAAEIGVASTGVTLTAEELAVAAAAQPVAITSVTGASLGTLSATVTYASGADWLAYSIDQNTRLLTLQPSTTNHVAPVTYSATVTVRSSRAGVRSKEINVTYTVSPRARTLIVAPHGTGSGRVTSTPAGIDCTLGESGAAGTCSANFPHATQVTLTAAAGAGTTFNGFTGECSGASCQLVMDQPRDQPRVVGAAFGGGSSRHPLTVAGAGDGVGGIVSSPAGFDCLIINGSASGVCSVDFPAGTLVTLTATPQAGSNYAFGGACSGTSCQVSMDQPRTVTVTFSRGNGSIEGQVLDAVTNEPLAGAVVQLTAMTRSSAWRQPTDTEGRYLFNRLVSGTYSMEVVRDGYVTNTAPSVTVEQLAGGDEVRVGFALPTNASTKRFASLSGRVVDAAGAPLANATVSISGGAQTNGVFQAATTDARGKFSLNGIVLDDASGQPIQQFVVFAAAPGFAQSARTVQLTRNQTLAKVRFALSRATTVEYFRDDFEGSDGPGWTATGFWNRINLATTTVTNSAYPTYVSLAPDDNSEGRLPAAASGSLAFWYGQPSVGNYLGPQISEDPPLSGGTGTGPNAGRITSPAFTIAGEAAVSLSFDTWFEIESVNPNASGFDIMSVIVMQAGGVEDTLGRVNPFVDPPLGEHDAVPFTSGGFNRAPVWRPAQFDLSAYRGRTIQLVFDFDTVDPSYNGFRGWIVDNVRVTNEAVTTPSAARAASSRLSPQRTLRQPRARPAPRNSVTRSEPR